jgi:hypothetical protein
MSRKIDPLSSLNCLGKISRSGESLPGSWIFCLWLPVWFHGLWNGWVISPRLIWLTWNARSADLLDPEFVEGFQYGRRCCGGWKAGRLMDPGYDLAIVARPGKTGARAGEQDDIHFRCRPRILRSKLISPSLLIDYFFCFLISFAIPAAIFSSSAM